MPFQTVNRDKFVMILGLWNGWAIFENIITVTKRVDITKMIFSVNDMHQCKFEHLILISRNMESGDASSPSTLLATRS